MSESHSTLFFEAPEQYLVVIASCTGTKLKPALEPFLASIIEKFPQTNFFQSRSDGSKNKPGTIQIVGGGEHRKLIICFAQFYAGKNNLPSDSRESRITWFKKCLDKIALRPDLESLAFPVDIATDGGGDWKIYQQTIEDFSKYIKLERPKVKTAIYPIVDKPPDEIPEVISDEESDQIDHTTKSSFSGGSKVNMIGLRGLQTALYNLDSLFLLDTSDRPLRNIKLGQPAIKAKPTPVKKTPAPKNIKLKAPKTEEPSDYIMSDSDGDETPPTAPIPAPPTAPIPEPPTTSTTQTTTPPSVLTTTTSHTTQPTTPPMSGNLICTANQAFSYNHSSYGKTLDQWIQTCHKDMSDQSGWKYTPLKPGQFGYDNMAVSIGVALNNFKTNPNATEDLMADWIHQGWCENYKYWLSEQPWTGGIYAKPAKSLDDERRTECAKLAYIDLPADEKEKDLIIARCLLRHLVSSTTQTPKDPSSNDSTTQESGPAPEISSKLIVAVKSAVKPTVKPIKVATEIKATEIQLVPIIAGAQPTTNIKYDANPKWQGLGSLPVDSSWSNFFRDSQLQSELKTLESIFEQELENFGDFCAILPQPPQNIFRAFQDPLEQVRVVILGQDPYHSNVDEAMGLAFSVPAEVTVPPSLKNIFKELKDDLPNRPEPSSGDLSHWTKQGVLLLNTSLTVRHKKPGVHLDHWQKFTDRVIELLAQDPDHPRVFLLWGNPAQKKANLIANHNRILKAVHPSPLSANRGGWFGTKPFSQTNQILLEWGLKPIEW